MSDKPAGVFVRLPLSDNRAGDAAEETAEICAQKIRNLGAAP